MAKLDRSKSIARFPTMSLSTKDYRWLHREAWEATQLRYFAASRPFLPLQFFTPPPEQINRRRQLQTGLIGQWIFEKPFGTPLAWVEAQAFFQRFGVCQLIVSPLESALSWSGEEQEALSIMVSALFITQSIDLLNLGFSIKASWQENDFSNWGQLKNIYSVKRDTLALNQKDLNLDPLTILEVDPIEWWETPWGKKDRKTLDYLVKRAKNA